MQSIIGFARGIVKALAKRNELIGCQVAVTQPLYYVMEEVVHGHIVRYLTGNLAPSSFN